MRPLFYDEPMNGLLTACNHVFIAENAEYTGVPAEGFEADHVSWVPLIKVSDLIAEKLIINGTTIAALLLAARERQI